MKILICVTYLTGGGAERVATLWSKGFVDRGYEVVIVLNTDVEVVSYPLPQSVAVYNIYKKENKILRELGFGVAKRLRKVLIKEQPNCVIGVLPSWCKIVWLANRGLHIPFIDTEHNAFERPAECPMPWKEYLEKFIFSQAGDCMTVLTHADYEIIGRKRNNVFILPNPLTYEPASEVPPKENIILACGRLDVWYTKGFDLLIKAWGTIANYNKGWKLIIAGDGNDINKNRLLKLSEEMGLNDSNFEMIGRCDDMLSLYQKSAIFVLSSRYEGFGMVLTEAMSQGCACIACDYKGRQAEIIEDNAVGLIIPPNDCNSLSEALNSLLIEKDLRIQLQQKGILRSYNYHIERIMKKWSDVFNCLDIQ